MRKVISIATGLLLLAAIATGCSSAPSEVSQPLVPDTSVSQTASGTPEPAASQAPADDVESIVKSYYAAQETEAWTYFQNNKVQDFMSQWVEADTGIKDPVWNYDSFTQFYVLDHDMESATRPDQEVYSLTFSDPEGKRFGCAVIEYNKDDPSIGKWSIYETTPELYDLAPNLDPIMEGLRQTDIDLATASASRVSWLERDKNRSDQVILFTDEKGDHYIYYLGDDAYEIEKVE